MLKKWIEKLKSVRLTRAQWGRVGYYGALATLLAILATASLAYRARGANVPEAAPQTAISAQAPIPLATPQPTTEPARWAWPLAGEIVNTYSPDAPMWSHTLEQWQTHPALDIAGSPGEAVYACRDGVVADAYKDRLWGNVIVVDHEEGYQSAYRGLGTIELVDVGQRIAAGEAIGSVGQSVPCEADLPAHLHFKLTRNGNPVDFEAIVGRESEALGMRN